MYPVRSERGAKAAVLRFRPSPEGSVHQIPDADRVAEGLMTKYACWNCHSSSPRDIKNAPPLDADTLVSRLTRLVESKGYAAGLRALDESPASVYAKHRATRQQLMSLSGRERVRFWLKSRLQDPLFDRSSSGMPALGLSDAHAQLVADYLMRRDTAPSMVGGFGRIRSFVKEALPLPRKPRYAHFLGAFAAGAGCMLLLLIAGWGGSRAMARRKAARR
jgi:hypothetical protein